MPSTQETLDGFSCICDKHQQKYFHGHVTSGAIKHLVAQKQPKFVNRHDHLKVTSIGNMRILLPFSAETAAGILKGAGL